LTYLNAVAYGQNPGNGLKFEQPANLPDPSLNQQSRDCARKRRISFGGDAAQ